MGVLSASSDEVTRRANLRTPDGAERVRGVLAVLGVVVWVVALVPPLATWARRYEFAQAVQFALFAMVVPALLVTGAPWKRLGLASGEPFRVGDDGAITSSSAPRFMDRVALRAQRRSGHVHVFSVGILFLALVIGWRTVPVVNTLVHHWWLAIIESISLVASGVWLWLTIVESPPVRASTTRPFRIGVAAVVMWTVWIIAYLNGMSQVSWYGAFSHVPGHGLSLYADQQLAAASMWFFSAATFMPIVFWNLIHWLQSEEDPNEELTRLVREQRSRGTFDPSA